MKVCIVGGCPNSEYLAPFSDAEWEIWALGNQYDRHINVLNRNGNEEACKKIIKTVLENTKAKRLDLLLNSFNNKFVI